MNPRIVYPIPKRQSTLYTYLRNYSRIAFLAAAVICIIVNLLTKTKPWSLVVAFSLFAVWRLAFSLKLVEFSIYAHAMRAFIYAMVLLGIIDHFLAPGWGQTVIPIVMFSTVLIMGIIYFAVYDRKDRHLASILLLAVLYLISLPYSLHSLPITNWVAFGFNVASFVLLVVMIIINRKEVIYELKARLNIKK
ncbi:MAG: hypothetical protein J5796_01415 [Erysipelotrichaceae bacterium]|nr:hypothetical protein [Erysipelotrichaceae bacterium]